jgi:hypothetical protein
MGIVLNQSLKKQITYIGFGIGATIRYIYILFWGNLLCVNYVPASKHFNAIVGFF